MAKSVEEAVIDDVVALDIPTFLEVCDAYQISGDWDEAASEVVCPSSGLRPVLVDDQHVRWTRG